MRVSLRYPIAATGQAIVLPDHVLAHLSRYRQTRFWQTEAGGQLFTKLDGLDIVVDAVTGPRRTDLRMRSSYRPNRAAERREIERMHAEGLHFLGDWHTHPEDRPTPSTTDIESLAECVRNSVHELNGFVLIIAGRLVGSEGLHVSINDGRQAIRLKAEQAEVVGRPRIRRL